MSKSKQEHALYLLIEELLDVGFPPMLADSLDFGDNAIVHATQLLQDAGGLIRSSFGMLKSLVEQIVSLSHEGVSVHVVHARQKQMVRVHQIVGDGGKVLFDPDKQAPTEVENVSGGARGFPSRGQKKEHGELTEIAQPMRPILLLFPRAHRLVRIFGRIFEQLDKDGLILFKDDIGHGEIAFERINLLAELRFQIGHIGPLFGLVEELDQTEFARAK